MERREFLKLLGLIATAGIFGCGRRVLEVIESPLLTIKLRIEDGNTVKEFAFPIEKGSTVYDVLKKASTTYNFPLASSLHSSYGVFVETIGNRTNDEAANLYWLYWTNGRFALLGSGSKKVADGETILWKYQQPA